MNTLVLDGIIFDGAADLLSLMIEEDQYILIACFYLFVLLAALTVMNMLIGVLCEVVSAVAETEHEELTIHYVRDRLQEIVNECCEFQEGEEIKINKETFLNILAYPSSAGLLNEVQVNVFGLVDLVDTIFASESGKEKVLDFGDLVETMLDQRETNTATVKDVTELRKYVRGRVDRLEALMEAHMVSLGRLMEKTNGLPPGTWQAELNKCRQELNLEAETVKQPPPKVKPNKPAMLEALPPPQESKPGISDVSTEGSGTALGNAVVLGRAVDAPVEKPETTSPDRAAPISSANEVAATEDIDSSLKDGTAGAGAKVSMNPSTKKRFQKKQRQTLQGGRSNNDEKTPLAMNADTAS